MSKLLSFRFKKSSLNDSIKIFNIKKTQCCLYISSEDTYYWGNPSSFMKHLTFPTHVHMLPVNHGFNIIFNVDCTLSFFSLSIP